MAGVSVLESFEVGPNSAIRTHSITLPNTADSADTVALTLSDYGISKTGLLAVKGFRHTTDGSVIVGEAVTTSVADGVLTVTLVAGTDDYRVIEFSGKGAPGDFS